MPSSKLALAVLAAVALPLPSAFAQTVPWQVVAGANADLAIPGFPAGSRSYTDVLLGDVGAGLVGVRMTSPTSAAGYWARRQGTWTRYATTGVAGATEGPGRTGAEAGHTFLSITTGGSGAGADGQRVFIARAGNAADVQNATWGLWRWDTNTNSEVARVLTDGVLGPGLGAGWVFPNDAGFASARMMGGGTMVINADATSPTGATRRMLARHVPGQGNLPCMVRQSTDPALSPGLSAGDSFDAAWGMSALALTPQGKVYGSFSASGSRWGIWEVCNGAPRAVAVNGEPGARGPEIGVSTATFASTSFDTPRPAANGFYFFASYRRVSSETSRLGLFWHDGAANRPLAINDDSGNWGPNWQGTTWRSFTANSLVGAGEYAAFFAQVNTTDGGNPSGLWRVRAGGTPELAALIGLTGDYGPEPNRTWSSFLGRAVLANGDIVVAARTNPGNELALWLLKSGAAPRRLLVAGQTVTIPTTSAGNVQATVNSVSIDDGAALYGGGEDSWAAADGSILVHADIVGYGGVRLLAIPSNPVNLVFRNGFDG